MHERTPVPVLLTVMLRGETDSSGSRRNCRLLPLTERFGERRMVVRSSGDGLGVLSLCPMTPDVGLATAVGGSGVGLGTATCVGVRGTTNHDGSGVPSPMAGGTLTRLEGRGVGISILS